MGQNPKHSILHPDLDPDLHLDLNTSSLLHSLSVCVAKTATILSKLSELRLTISTHRDKILRVKTSGTAATTLGTGLAVTGLILAPFTFGTSLIVSSLGAVTTVGGAATNMVADLVDSSRRKRYLTTIQELANDQQTSKQELTQLLTQLQDYLDPFLARGLSKSEALYATLTSGDRANPPSSDKEASSITPEDFEWISDPPPNWSKPVKRFAFKASFQSLKLVKSSHALSALSLATRSGGGVVASTASNVSLGVGRLLGNVVLKSSLAVVGVLFTSLDIAFLVREWKAEDPTGDAVDFVREELTKEIEQMEELSLLLKEVRSTAAFRGWVGGRRVLGTSPFPVKAFLALCRGEEDAQFYGGMELEQDFTPEMFWVGVAHTVEQAGDNIPDENPDESDLQTEPISEINQIFPPSLGISELRPIPVVNQSVLHLYSGIIRDFLEAHKLPKYSQLEVALRRRNSGIVSDFQSPFTSHMSSNISQVCVSYVPCTGYYNANKWEYDLILGLLLKLVGQYFAQVYQNCQASKDTLDFVPNSEKSDQISELVEVLINHKSYLDPVAVIVWSNNAKNKETLTEVDSSLQGLFRNLKWKIEMWAWDIFEVVQKS